MSNIGLSVAARSEKLPAGNPKSARRRTDMKADLQKVQFTVETSKAQKLEESKGGAAALNHPKITDKVRKKSEIEKYEKVSSVRSLQGERKCLTLSVNFMPLLAGDVSVSGRLQQRSPHILHCLVTVALNAPLLSDQQRRDLNPMTIRILSATSLPASPAPITVLQKKCVPVYCKYRFQDLPVHQTHGQTHGTHVFFRDVNVVFVGTMSPGKLRESLLGPPIEIEVHDRDQRIQKSICKPSLYGMEPEDEKLSNVGLVTSRSTVHNPFMEPDKLSYPYGIAKLGLSELVYGATYLNMSVPIHGCDSPDAAEYYSDSTNGGMIGAVGDGHISPLPVGHYLEAQSLLKVRVDLAVPLSSDTGAPDCPFGRILYIFDYKNNELFRDLIAKITAINCHALGLDPDPKMVSSDVLSRVCLTDEQKGDPSLDVITGIHIMDGDVHLFALEGLRQDAIKELWKTIPTRAAEQKGKLKILYNSEMAFHERLYKDVGVLVSHVLLHQPLHTLLNQPLLYIRDMVPPLCFQALSRLDYICRAKKLQDVIQSDLLPSVEMIHLLSREFGVPLKPGDLCADKEHIFSKKLVISGKEDTSLRCPWHLPLDNYNELYIQLKKELENCKTKDHIQMNIDRVWQMSRELKTPKVEHVAIPADGTTVHNYSSQTLNSTQLALKILRQKMAADAHGRFSDSLDYQSAAVSPVDVVEEEKKRGTESRERWTTPSGFLYPGFRSSIESNKHPKQPDDARIVELRKVWKENILHSGTLRPTLPRDPWRWADRHIDFDLYKKPHERSSLSAPLTVCLTDDTLQDETFSDIKQNMRFHRCLPQTELTVQGSDASNQQSRLEGLLKDKGAKLSLRRAGLALKQPIPALSVIPKSGNKMVSNNKGFIPGELADHSLKWSDNVIPRQNTDSDTFHRMRGKHFMSNATDHSVIYKRKIKDLSKDEKISFIFLKSGQSDIKKANSAPKTADDRSKVIEIQSHEGFLLHIQ